MFEPDKPLETSSVFIERREGKRGTTFKLRWRERADRSEKWRERAITYKSRKEAERQMGLLLAGQRSTTLHGSVAQIQAEKQAKQAEREARYFEKVYTAWRVWEGALWSDSTNSSQDILRKRMTRWEGIPVDEITAEMVREWVYEDLSKSYKLSTVKLTVSQFSRVMNYAQMHGLIRLQPVLAAKLKIFEDAAEYQIITPAQAEAFIKAIKWSGNRLQARVVLSGGLRWGESIPLLVSDFNASEGTLEVSKSVSEHKGKLELGPTKTRRSRVVGLTPRLVEDLKEYIETEGLKPVDLLFPGRVSKGWRYLPRAKDETSWWHGAVERVRAEDPTFPADFTPHGLRHTAASIMIRQGLDPATVSAQLGHRDVGTTLKYYVNLFRDSPNVAAQAMAEALDI